MAQASTVPPSAARSRRSDAAAKQARAGGKRRSVLSIRLLGLAAAATVLFLVVNWIYQVVRKPTELLFPVSSSFVKTPAQTWREYAPVFREQATTVITAPLLAALAQVEASGNPLVRTYWRWSWLARPFEMWRPASSAVGMYQMTNGTFEEARHYCIRDHVAMHDSVQEDGHTCPLMRIYTRLLPSDAVELTSAYLDVHVAAIVAHLHGVHPSLRQKQDLAALIHLCGAGAADAYARRGFKLNSERCGDHDPRVYLARVNTMKAVFTRLAAQDAGPAQSSRSASGPARSPAHS
jgi:hypothetical protein